MSGLSNATSFQASLEQKSEFYDGVDPVRQYGYYNAGITGTTTVTGLFSDLLADLTCKGVAIEYFVVSFTAGQEWDSDNNFTIQLLHDDGTDNAIFEFDGGEDVSNIDTNTVYVDMMDYPKVASTFYEAFNSASETFSLVFTEEGTATMTDINVSIRYKKVPGANALLATEAA